MRSVWPSTPRPSPSLPNDWDTGSLDQPLSQESGSACCDPVLLQALQWTVAEEEEERGKHEAGGGSSFSTSYPRQDKGLAGAWDQPGYPKTLGRFLRGRNVSVTSGIVQDVGPFYIPHPRVYHTPLSSAAPSAAGPGPTQQPPHHQGDSKTACQMEEGHAQRQEGIEARGKR